MKLGMSTSSLLAQLLLFISLVSVSLVAGEGDDVSVDAELDLADVRAARDIFEDRIVGGQVAPKGRYEYMVGLLKSENARPYCGGVLVTPSVVYSAAHCSEPKWVSIGCHNVNDNCLKAKVDKNIVHPGYQSNPNPKKDFRLIVLENPVTTIAPIAFVADSEWSSIPKGRDVTVIGWGATSSGGSGSNALREVEVDIVRRGTCSWKYSGTGSSIDSSMICAARSGKDSCQGDSGGPLFVKCNSGKDVLVGVVSFGIGCASSSYPGVYGAVHYADTWFRDQLDAIGESISTPPPVTNACSGGSGPSPGAQPTPFPTSYPTPFPEDSGSNSGGGGFCGGFFSFFC